MINKFMNISFKSFLENMEDILAPQSNVPQIGSEKLVYKGEITKVASPHGSVRYLYVLKNQIVSALQIVSNDKGKTGIVARVTTLPQFHRMGFASRLLERARQEFKNILPAQYVTDPGKAWTDKNFQKS